MSTTVQKVLAEAQQLSPVEQLDLIRALSESLRSQVRQQGVSPEAGHTAAIPDSVRRAPPVTNLDELVADFWPDDESADDLVNFVRQQREADRLSE